MHIGVLLATVALVTYGAIIIWSASQFKADASFSRHLLGSVLARCWRTRLAHRSAWHFQFSTALLVIDLIVIFSPKIPACPTGGFGHDGLDQDSRYRFNIPAR
ncbi:MAG: hypothetical protein ACLTYW_01995 [Collinsella sp.]